jgi:hypothetical protein
MELKRCEHGVLELNNCYECLPYNWASKIGEEPKSIFSDLTEEQIERVLNPDEYQAKQFAVLKEEVEALREGKNELKILLKEACLESDKYRKALIEIRDSQEPWEPQRTIAIKALEDE